MRLFFLLLPFIVQASDLYRLSDFNWRPSSGEVYYQTETGYSFGGMKMIIPSVMSSEIEHFEVSMSNRFLVGITERLDMGIKVSYSFISESKWPTSKEIKRGIQTPSFTMSYQLQEEYPADFGLEFAFSFVPKIGEAVDLLDDADKTVGGNKLSPSSIIGSILTLNKSLGDYWQLRFGVGWLHSFPGEKIKRKDIGESLTTIESSDVLLFTAVTKHEIVLNHFINMSFLLIHAFEATSISALGDQTQVESTNSVGLGLSYGIELDDSTYLTLGSTVLFQFDYTLNQASTIIEISDTVSYGLSLDCAFLL